LRGEPYSQFLTPGPDFSSFEHLEDEPPSKIEGRKESARLANPNIFKNLLRVSMSYSDCRGPIHRARVKRTYRRA
jgi:hypothetical protein